MQVRKELFKKFYKTSKDRPYQFDLNQTDDAVECFQVLLKEYHDKFSTLAPDTGVKIPKWKLESMPPEQCGCLVHEVFQIDYDIVKTCEDCNH